MDEELEIARKTTAHPVAWTRRRLLGRGSVAVVGTTIGAAIGLNLGIRPAYAAPPPGRRPALTLLRSSSFVYISPIKADGSESTCHDELWYAWLDDSVVVTVAADRWKATALGQGLKTARIWVGNHGRWKTIFGGRNERFREAPNFVAQAEQIQDKSAIEPLLAIYEKKYPTEIAGWRDGMRSGNADGSRIMIRYRVQKKS